MFRSPALLGFTLLAATLTAGDFGPVVKAASLIYPGKAHFGVVCNYGFSHDQVADLQRALPEGSRLTVVDVRHPMGVGPASSVIRQRGVELLALVSKDPLIRDGSPHATALVSQVATTIPAFGTTPAALKNGCALAMGEATNWELMINPKLLDPGLKGIVGPAELTPMGSNGKGTASLEVIQNR